MGPRPNPDTKTNLEHSPDNLYPLPASRTKLPVSLKRLNEMKNVSQWTPPKILKTIWVKPLFQSFQAYLTLRNKVMAKFVQSDSFWDFGGGPLSNIFHIIKPFQSYGQLC